MNADNTSTPKATGPGSSGPYSAHANPASSQASAGGISNARANTPLPKYSALRRQRLKMARYLRVIACLSEQIDEVHAEISSLEAIVGAQADTISALRHQLQNSKK